jgi:[acyl-carrier-protein] S-malonyltransferase
MSDQTFAFVFPGQGSQAVTMLADFADEVLVQETFAEASEVLGYDLWKLVSEGPAEQLNETHRTQPALLAVSTALWRLWRDNSTVTPLYVAGHSLGEYSALVAADAIDFAAAVKLVEMRGQFMQQAVPAGSGKMAAIIGLADNLIQAACAEAAGDEVVSPVNFNSPGQVVIAGNSAAVDRAMELCRAKGAKRALPLPVSVPSHCSLMKPAAKSLQQALNDITLRTPKIPVVNNVDVAIANDEKAIKDALVRQLYCPVRWTETIKLLGREGVTDLVECGPGNVLSGLAKRIDKDFVCHAIAKKDLFNQLVELVS